MYVRGKLWRKDVGLLVVGAQGAVVPCERPLTLAPHAGRYVLQVFGIGQAGWHCSLKAVQDCPGGSVISSMGCPLCNGPSSQKDSRECDDHEDITAWS